MGCASSSDSASQIVSERLGEAPQSFFESYALAEKLGVGSFSEVHAVRGGDGDRSMAVKIVSLRGAGGVGSAARLKRAHDEYAIWRSFAAHPNVVQIFGFYLEQPGQSDATACFLMERCDETLSQRLNLFSSTGTLGFPLSNLREVFRGMLSAVSHIHAHNVVHRDVNVDNLLMASGHATEVKLCDFGTAIVLPRCGYLTGAAGTPSYMAPEAIGGDEYGFGVDTWACGVCVYNVLFNDFPYALRDDVASLAEAICDGRLPRFAPPRRSVAPAPALAVALARALLTRDAQLRPTAEAALELALFQPPGPARLLTSTKSLDLSEVSTDEGDSDGGVNSRGGRFWEMGQRSFSRPSLF